MQCIECIECTISVLKGRLKPLNSTHGLLLRKARTFKDSKTHFSMGDRITQGSAFLLAEHGSMESECSCGLLERVGKSGGNFLLMIGGGGSEGELLQAKLLLPWKAQDRAFKGTIRKFRKLNCNTLGREIRESVMRRQPFKRTIYP